MVSSVAPRPALSGHHGGVGTFGALSGWPAEENHAPRTRTRIQPALSVAAACQAMPPGGSSPAQGDRTRAAAATGGAGLNAVPNCASGLSATLSDGLRVGYRGSDPNDPDRCLLDWSGRRIRCISGCGALGRTSR